MGGSQSTGTTAAQQRHSVCSAANAPVCYMGFTFVTSGAPSGTDCSQICIAQCGEWIDSFWEHLPTKFLVHIDSDQRVLEVLSIYFRLLPVKVETAGVSVAVAPLMELTLVPDIIHGGWTVYTGREAQRTPTTLDDLKANIGPSICRLLQTPGAISRMALTAEVHLPPDLLRVLEVRGSLKASGFSAVTAAPPDSTFGDLWAHPAQVSEGPAGDLLITVYTDVKYGPLVAAQATRVVASVPSLQTKTSTAAATAAQPAYYRKPAPAAVAVAPSVAATKPTTPTQVQVQVPVPDPNVVRAQSSLEASVLADIRKLTTPPPGSSPQIVQIYHSAEPRVRRLVAQYQQARTIPSSRRSRGTSDAVCAAAGREAADLHEIAADLHEIVMRGGRFVMRA